MADTQTATPGIEIVRRQDSPEPLFKAAPGYDIDDFIEKPQPAFLNAGNMGMSLDAALGMIPIDIDGEPYFVKPPKINAMKELTYWQEKYDAIADDERQTPENMDMALKMVAPILRKQVEAFGLTKRIYGKLVDAVALVRDHTDDEVADALAELLQQVAPAVGVSGRYRKVTIEEIGEHVGFEDIPRIFRTAFPQTTPLGLAEDAGIDPKASASLTPETGDPSTA